MSKTPPLPVLFLLFSIIALVQIPAAWLIRQNVGVGILLNEWLVIAGIPFALTVYFKWDVKVLFPFGKTSYRTLFWTALLTICVCIVIDTLTFVTEKISPLPAPFHKLFGDLMATRNLGEGVWKVFLLCFTPGFCEELFFRGFFQRSLLARYKPTLGIGITALCFALVHGNPWYLPLYFLLGLYLGWLGWKCSNLWIPVVAHTINNSWTYLTHIAGRDLASTQRLEPFDLLLTAMALVSIFWIVKRLK